MKMTDSIKTFSIIIFVMLLIPPHREVGKWSNVKALGPVPKALESQLNRQAFGILPAYRPIGFGQTTFWELGKPTLVPSKGMYGLVSSEFYIAWDILIAQGVILALVLTFYYRHKGSVSS